MVKNFFTGLVNIGIFLPYFFSVPTLLSTLFARWKGLGPGKPAERGFSLAQWGDRVSYELISRGIGFVMRASLLIFYVFFQIGYILTIPVVSLMFFLLWPLLTIVTSSKESGANKHLQDEADFLATHILDPKHTEAGKAWFQVISAKRERGRDWWKLENLMKTPPLARDWAAGYTPTLDEFATELTSPGYITGVRAVVGRKDEIRQIEEVLSASEKANVLLVGDEGVGKHAVVDALASRIYFGTCNPILAYKRVLQLQMERILAQELDQSRRETILNTLLDEAVKAGNVVVIIDQIDRYVSDSPGHVNMASPLITHGEKSGLQIVGITTPHANEAFIAPNGALTSIFTKVIIPEIDQQRAVSILQMLVPIFETRYRIIIPYDTLLAICVKSDYFITTIPFPEKAISLLDKCGSFLASQNQGGKTVQTLMPEVVDTVLSTQTHTPTTITAEIKEKLVNLEQTLSTQVIGQETAIFEVASALRRAYLLLGKRKKPLASFLFVGPTGVGKTELAKALMRTFFGGTSALLRFDMSNYQSIGNIPQLLGTSVSSEPGLLTRTIREHPYGVLLLDEIEKAHPNLLNIFLSVLDEGYFTSGSGERVDCKNLCIIATSNAGAVDLYAQPGQTLRAVEVVPFLVERKLFSPEFLNRFDGVVAFNPLSPEAVFKIAKIHIAQIAKDLEALHNVHLTVADATIQKLAQDSYDPRFGARDMDRLLRTQIEDVVAKKVLGGLVDESRNITL